MRAPIQLVVFDNAAGLVWAVQMNTVVFHPWPSRVGNTDNPDQLRIDLDPQPGTDFDDAVPAAIELREVLREAGLESFLKTSGNRGIHVYRTDRGRVGVSRRASRGDRGRARTRTQDARQGHDVMVEGGARHEGVRRLQPGEP